MPNLRANTVQCFIGIGSNLEEPVSQVNQALAELDAIPSCKLRGTSSLYQTAPIGPGKQAAYINAVAMLDCQLPATELLDQLQAIEHKHGRQRKVRWAPRTLDLDILLFGDQRIETERLQVPHREIFRRNFVLVPLAELVPQWVFPDGSNLPQRLQECPHNDIVKLSSPDLTQLTLNR